MARVTIEKAETPSESVIRAANQSTSVTDSRGRTIGIRKLNALTRMRMLEVVGAENSKNEIYLGYAALAFSVSSIDGEAVITPSNKMGLEALIQRLEDEGLDAVAQYLGEQAVPAGKEAIKN